MLIGCGGGTSNGGSGSSAVSLGTLPGGAQVVVSAATFSVDSAHGSKNVGTISIRGNASAGNYTLSLNETTTSGTPSDNTLVLNPDPCTIGSGGSCNIVYTKYSSLVVNHSVQIIATDSKGNSIALPIKIQVHVSATALSTSSFQSAVTAMAVDSSGNVYAATNGTATTPAQVWVAASSDSPTWTQEPALPASNGNYPVNTMITDSNNNLYIHTTEGISGTSWKLVGNTWQKLNMPAVNTYFYSMVADNSGNVYAGGWDGQQGAIFALASGNTSWVTLPQGNIPGYGTNPTSNRYNFATAMTIDNVNHNIYIGTLGGNVYAYYLPGSTVGPQNTLYTIPTPPTGSRVTALTMGLGSNTAVFAATVGNGLAQLICLPQNCAGTNQPNWAANSGNYHLQPPANTIFAMTYSQDYPGQTDCGTLHFITDGSQSEWSDQTCGIGAQFGGGTPASANWDGGIVPPSTTSIYQMVMNVNGAIYAGTSDGNVLMKRKTFNLIINSMQFPSNFSSNIGNNCQNVLPGNNLCTLTLPANFTGDDTIRLYAIAHTTDSDNWCTVSVDLNTAVSREILNISPTAFKAPRYCSMTLASNIFSVSNQGCVTDQSSGLIWSTTMLSAGTYDQVNSQISQINTNGGRCGFSNGWRLPSDTELLPLVPSYITPEYTTAFWNYSGFAFPNSTLTLWSSTPTPTPPYTDNTQFVFAVNYSGTNYIGFVLLSDIYPALMVHDQ